MPAGWMQPINPSINQVEVEAISSVRGHWVLACESAARSPGIWFLPDRQPLCRCRAQGWSLLVERLVGQKRPGDW